MSYQINETNDLFVMKFFSSATFNLKTLYTVHVFYTINFLNCTCCQSYPHKCKKKR